jgi:hypothetical protein
MVFGFYLELPDPSFGLDFCSVNALRPGLGQEIWDHQNRCYRFPGLGQAEVCLNYNNLG